jgi:maltose O-acetyltransferase
MPDFKRLLCYDWPAHFALILTDWLPDNTPFLSLRGKLLSTFFKRCGRRLQIGRQVSFYNPSQICLGDDVYIAHGSRFIADGLITIGNQVLIGPYCIIASSNHAREEGSFRQSEPQLSPITIGSGCWLGAHVVVTAGSSIGEGSLIAAGAVVSGDIPAKVMAGGLPARMIKEYIDET